VNFSGDPSASVSAFSGVSGENRRCCKVCLDLLYIVMPSFWRIHRHMAVSLLFFYSDHLSDELHHGRTCSSSPSAGHDALQASDAKLGAPLCWP